MYFREPFIFISVSISRTTTDECLLLLANRLDRHILINCLIVRNEFRTITDDFGPDSRREVDFRFLKVDLEYANIVPETGDIVMYNELYYEVDNTNENQYFLGKNPQYAYSDGLDNFGASISIILSTHMTSPERLGITKERL